MRYCDSGVGNDDGEVADTGSQCEVNEVNEIGGNTNPAFSGDDLDNGVRHGSQSSSGSGNSDDSGFSYSAAAQASSNTAPSAEKATSTTMKSNELEIGIHKASAEVMEPSSPGVIESPNTICSAAATSNSVNPTTVEPVRAVAHSFAAAQTLSKPPLGKIQPQTATDIPPPVLLPQISVTSADGELVLHPVLL